MAVDPLAAIRRDLFQTLQNATNSPDPAVAQAAQDAMIALKPTMSGLNAVQTLAAGTTAEKVRAIRIVSLYLNGLVGGS